MERRQFLQQICAGGGVATAGALVGGGLGRGPVASAAPAAATTGPVVYVAAPTGDATTDTAAIQDAINGSATGSIIVFAPMAAGHPYVVNQTIVLLAQRTYVGSDRTATVVQAAPSSNLAAVFAGQAWWESWTTAGLPFSLESLTIDGNSANNTSANGGHGLVFQNYRAVIRDVFVQNTPGSGIVLADQNRAGKLVTNSLIENRILDCTVSSPKQYGIWVQDHNDSGRATDGYVQRCVVQSATLDSIKIDRSSGWFITENHVYTCQGNGIMLDQFWCTFCYDNEVDGFGLAGAAGAAYYGIGVQNVIYDRPGEIHNCIVATNENAAAHGYHYYYVHLATGTSGAIVMTDNVAYRDEPTGKPAPVSIGFEYNAIAPDILTVRGHVANLSFGPVTSTLVDGGGSVVFDDPVPAHASQHAAGGTDPLFLAGIASTFAPALAAGGTKAPGTQAALFALFLSWGVTTSGGLRLVIGASSGNISVGVYGSQGTASARTPGPQKATSGSIPCPAVGMATVSLGSTPVTIDQFDYGAVSADNDTVAFAGTSSVNPLMTAGAAAFAVHSHPLPSTATASNGSTQIPWIATP